MNYQQLNLFAMMQAVKRHLDANTALWNSLSPVAETVATFNACLSQIAGLIDVQKDGTNNGYTSVIEQKMQVMGDNAISIADALQSYAKKINDPVILFSVAYSSVGVLLRGKRPVVIERCETILKMAEKNISQLADFKVTQEKTDALKAAIADTSKAISDRDQKAEQAKSATKLLRQCFSNARQELADLNRLLNNQVEDKTFLAAFGAAIVVHNYHGKTAKKQAGTPATNASAGTAPAAPEHTTLQSNAA